jgi:hypothetical protein
VTVTDLMVGPDRAVYPWRPSPDEDNLERYTALINSLIATRRGASPLHVIRVTADGRAYQYSAPGPVRVVGLA